MWSVIDFFEFLGQRLKRGPLVLLHELPTKQCDLFLYSCVSQPPLSGRITNKGQKTAAREVSLPNNMAEHRRYHEREDFISTHAEIRTQPEFSFTFHHLLLYPHGANLFCGSLSGAKHALACLQAGGCWAAKVIAVGADSDNLLFYAYFLSILTPRQCRLA